MKKNPAPADRHSRQKQGYLHTLCWYCRTHVPLCVPRSRISAIVFATSSGLSTTAHESTFDFVMGGAVGGLADSVDTKKVLEAQRRYKNSKMQSEDSVCTPGSLTEHVQ